MKYQLHIKAVLSIKESLLVSKSGGYPGGFEPEEPLRELCNYFGIDDKKILHTNVLTCLFLLYFQIFRNGGSIMD